jgi:hypothetical protein
MASAWKKKKAAALYHLNGMDEWSLGKVRCCWIFGWSVETVHFLYD